MYYISMSIPAILQDTPLYPVVHQIKKREEEKKNF